MIISILQDRFDCYNPEENYTKIRDAYRKAVKEKADILVVPSEALCGYDSGYIMDFSGYPESLTSLQNRLAAETVAETALIFDTPFAADGSYAPSLLMAYGGRVCEWVSQELDEETVDMTVNFKGKRIFVSFFATSRILESRFVSEHVETADAVVLLDARPFMLDMETKRLNILEGFAQLVPTLVYVGHAGIHGAEVLTGASSVYVQGRLRIQLPYFKKAAECFDSENVDKRKKLPTEDIESRHTELIHDALVCAIEGYFKATNTKTAVIGLSGGIDSSVVLPLAVEALGRKNVLGIMMPSRFSSNESLEDAVLLAEKLQIYYNIIPIEPIYVTMLNQMESFFKDTPFGLAEENLQARIRGNILMAVANKRGAIVLNTTNKSEAICGYGTLYGDLCGGLSVLGDLYKSEVYGLADYINRKEEIIPRNCITKAPSAELHPDQKDSDSLPDYDLIEMIMRLHLEQHCGEKDLLRSGLDKNIVKRVLTMFYRNEFKRRQAPPAIRLTSTALSSLNLPF